MKWLSACLFAAVVVFSLPARAQVPDEIRTMFSQFLREYNARNVAGVGQMLQDSRDFSWVGADGTPVIGRDAALARLTATFKAPQRIEAEMRALKIETPDAQTARLQVPVRQSDPAAGNSSDYLLTQTYVKTVLGWRIASIAQAPLAR